MIRVRVEGWAAFSLPEGATLLQGCEAAGIPMESACGGFACCNSCRVGVLEGDCGVASAEEEPFLDLPSQRLGCQWQPLGDVTVSLQPGA